MGAAPLLSYSRLCLAHGSIGNPHIACCHNNAPPAPQKRKKTEKHYHLNNNKLDTNSPSHLKKGGRASQKLISSLHEEGLMIIWLQMG